MNVGALTPSQREALDLLQIASGRWQEPRGSRKPFRDLVSLGLAEGDGHGKFRATSDAMEGVES